MRVVKFTISLLLLLILGIGATAQTPEESSSSNTGSISGRVLNESGQPVANASVFVRPVGSVNAPAGQVVATSPDGTFTVAGLTRGFYSIFHTAPAHALPVPPPDTPPSLYVLGDNVSLTLIRGGVVTGTVTDQSGEPVVGVGVRAIMVKDAEGRQPRNLGLQPSERTTDDRGVYRIYGLLAGTYIIQAGGRGPFGFQSSGAFDSDAPTYAPSATRETAIEVQVRTGEETTGVDIRYRGELGYTISGTVTSTTQAAGTGTSVTLRRVNGTGYDFGSFYFIQPRTEGFAFQGLANGEYEIESYHVILPGEFAWSEPRRVIVKGADVSGIGLSPKPLNSVGGQMVLQPSNHPQCSNKRTPLLTETLVTLQRSRQPDEPVRSLPFGGGSGTPDATGQFLLRNVLSGRYVFGVRFVARYWYLHGVHGPANVNNTRVDFSKHGLQVTSGEKVPNVTVTLAGGAASLRGRLKENNAPANFSGKLFLVPAEREAADNALRYYVTAVEADGTFLLSHLAPGKYLVLLRSGADEINQNSLRDPAKREQLNKLKSDAAANSVPIELSPCQNITDFEVAANKT